MKKWLCTICGWIYDEAKGWPADGIAPGTQWQDIPPDWVCPDCGVAKADFEMLEVTEEIACIGIAEPPKKAPIVIVGSGYAGLSLAAAIRQKSADKEIIIFTSDEGSNYSKPALSNALARNKSPVELVTETALDIEHRLNLRLYARCNVLKIAADDHLLMTDLGIQSYSKLILAQGSEPIKSSYLQNNHAQISGSEDVLSINNLNDYQYFRDKLESSLVDVFIENPTHQHITIIGNGLIGCEFADDLSAKGYRVSVIGLGDWPMQRLIPKEIGQALAHKLTEKGVDWHFRTTVSSINLNPTLANNEQQSNKYQIKLNNGKSIDTDLVLSAIGLKPRTDLAKTANVHCDLGIIVNSGMKTNVADIYAIGDCAEINGTLLPFIAPINYGAAALANCILNKPTMVHYPVMPVIVKTPIFPITLVSPATVLAAGKNQWIVEKTDAGIRALLVNSNREIIGFALAGEITAERQKWIDKITEDAPKTAS